MPNTNCLEGFKCPECGHDESFFINVTSSYEALMTDAGVVQGKGDADYDRNSACRCGHCAHQGVVGDFIQNK